MYLLLLEDDIYKYPPMKYDPLLPSIIQEAYPLEDDENEDILKSELVGVNLIIAHLLPLTYIATLIFPLLSKSSPPLIIVYPPFTSVFFYYTINPIAASTTYTNKFGPIVAKAIDVAEAENFIAAIYLTLPAVL
jgi:hypothetical protein